VAPRDPRRFGGRSRYREELLTVAAVLAEVDLPRRPVVVMASCSTGLPSRHPAGELTGFPAAFLAAGAEAVVGALWPVADAAAAVLMQLFYERRQTGLDPAAALSGARGALRGVDRAEAVDRLGGPGVVLPPGDRPFDAPHHRLAFQHFGAGRPG
jgi:CHAT domain-containing protein